MSYTSGGGNIPLTAYVEVLDHTSVDYSNISYYNLWEFTAGTRVGMGKNSASGTLGNKTGDENDTSKQLQWGIHLVA